MNNATLIQVAQRNTEELEATKAHLKEGLAALDKLSEEHRSELHAIWEEIRSLKDSKITREEVREDVANHLAEVNYGIIYSNFLMLKYSM